MRTLRTARGNETLCATTCNRCVRGEPIDHRDGTLHRLDEMALAALAPRKGTLPPATPAVRIDPAPAACGVDDQDHGPGHDHASGSSPGADIVAGASCRRECVLLCDSDHPLLQSYGLARANTSPAIAQTINTIDAVCEKHVGVPLAAGGHGPWLGRSKSAGIWRWITLESCGFTLRAACGQNNSGDRARWWTPDGAIRAT